MITVLVATFYVKKRSLEFRIEKINYLASTHQTPQSNLVHEKSMN